MSVVERFKAAAPELGPRFLATLPRGQARKARRAAADLKVRHLEQAPLRVTIGIKL